MPPLENGRTFPPLHLPLVGGGALSLPEDVSGDFGVALSVDDEDTSTALVDKLHLNFPIAHTVDADRSRRRWAPT